MASNPLQIQIQNPYDPRGTTITGTRQLTPAEIADKARAQGSAAGAASSLGANVQQGQANQKAGAGAMANASNMAAYRANPNPMPAVGGGLMGGGGGLNTQYATMGNIQQYMNPYLDQIIKNGTGAIEHSAASKGLFGSSGNVNDIGNWAANQTYQAQNDAFDRFAADRGYMTDNYWNTLQNNQDQSWKTYGANWDQYKYGNADYLARQMDAYNRGQDLVKTGQNATNTYSDSANQLAQAMALLFGGMGNVNAQGVSNQSDIFSGLIDDLMKMKGSQAGGAK